MPYSESPTVRHQNEPHGPDLDRMLILKSDWEKISAEVEVAQGKAIADAAVAAGATQIIWSSLPRGEKTADGGFSAPKQFVSKADVEDYIRTLPIKSMFFMPGWFMQNHFQMMPPQKVRGARPLLNARP